MLYRGGNRIILDVHGVGYDVMVSVSCLEVLSREDEAFIHVHTTVRENAIELYGFATDDEKRVFEMLLGVAGIGPKTALATVSGAGPTAFRDAVLDGDVQRLVGIPGIGKKTAERIIVELKEKVRKQAQLPNKSGAARTGTREDDLVSSLVNLGYKEKIAEMTARRVIDKFGKDLEISDLVRAALKELAGNAL
jgi:Holliday junction DNA helicase RuvA